MLRKHTLVAVLLTLVAGATLWTLGRPETVAVARVEASSLTHSLVSSGRVFSRDRASLSFLATGRLSSVHVNEGDSVSRGMVLARSEDDEATANLEQAKAQLAQAEIRLGKVRDTTLPQAEEALKQAEALFIQAKRQRDNLKELHSRQLASSDVLDTAEETLRVRNSQLNSARLGLETLRLSGRDYQQSLADVALARATIKAALARAEQHVIRAPADGTIVRRLAEPGDIIVAGKTVLELVPFGQREILLEIDEKNLRWLRPNQTATVIADAFPKQPLKARIVAIAPGVNADSGTIQVRLKPDTWPAFLLEDMTVSAEIVFSTTEKALVVPVAALQGDAAPFVWRVKDNLVAKAPVVVGVRDEHHAEILSGLSKGELIVISPPATLAEGTTVSPSLRAD